MAASKLQCSIAVNHRASNQQLKREPARRIVENDRRESPDVVNFHSVRPRNLRDIPLFQTLHSFGVQTNLRARAKLGANKHDEKRLPD
jgi:hypothetical protein